MILRIPFSPTGSINANEAPGHVLSRADVSEEIIKKMEKIIFNTKGVANRGMFFDMCLAGVDEKTIIKVATQMEASKYFYETDENGKIKNRKQDDRIAKWDAPLKSSGEPVAKKHIPGSILNSTPVRNTYRYRVFEKYLGSFKELTDKDPDTISNTRISAWSMFGESCMGKIDTCCGKVNGFRPAGVGMRALAMFVKYDEGRRAEITKNELTKKVLVTRDYSNYVPQELAENGMTEAQFVKRQTVSFYDDLYWLSQTNANEEVKDVDIEKLPSTVRTLSQLGYQTSAITKSKMIALLETAQLSLENIGLAVWWYDEDGRYLGNNYIKRGYHRLLQKIVAGYKNYDKLIKQGFKPETARQTVMEQLKFEIQDGGVINHNWRVSEVKTWKPPVVEVKKAKTPKGKRKMSTMADIMALGKE